MTALLIATTASPLAAAMQEIRAMRPCRKFEGHTGQVEDVIYLPRRQRMMTCSYDGSLRVWNLESGEQIGEDWRDGECRVLTIASSPDKKKVVSGSDDGAVRLWDIDTGKVIAKWTGNSEPVRSVSWNRDGVRVVSGSDDGTAKVWDVESGEITLEIKTELTNVTAVIYSPDSTMIATGVRRPGFNQFINIWDSGTGDLIANLTERIGSVDCLAWTADGKTLFSGSFHGSARTWDTTTWQEITVLTEHTHWISALALSPNGRIFASASSHSVQLWNLENGQPISLPLQHATGVGCMSFSTDGKLLATGCLDNAAYTWDVSAILKEADLDELLSNANVS
jgi:WD40 repeat protein